jgi:hypothetical protein
MNPNHIRKFFYTDITYLEDLKTYWLFTFHEFRKYYNNLIYLLLIYIPFHMISIKFFTLLSSVVIVQACKTSHTVFSRMPSLENTDFC